VLSHSHDDHTGGWRSLRKKFSASLAVADVGEGFFIPRIKAKTTANNRITDSTGAYNLHADSVWYTNTGGRFNVLKTFTEIYPGIYLTGPAPRKYPEKIIPKVGCCKTAADMWKTMCLKICRWQLKR
jgi:7,8-dihydropterin-6-yl-methyl-4-(beta-D-ribofuranosyl)aminobenzene 5'-phosphate synthase